MNQRKDIDRFFVKNEAKDLCKYKIGHFFVFSALSSVICLPVHFFNTSCGLKVLIKTGSIKKFIQGKIWRNSRLLLLWTRLPKERKNLALNRVAIFCHYQNYSHVWKEKIKLKIK